MRRIAVFLCMAAVMASCAVGEVPENGGVRSMIDVSVVIDGEEDVDVRSILPEESIETLITDVTVASYSEDGIIIDVRYFEGWPSKMDIHARKYGSTSIYALANMGDMSRKFPKRESELKDLNFTVGTYEEISRKGIPMCGMVSGVPEGAGSVVVRLERLFAKISLRILHSGIDGASDALFVYNMCNKSAYIRQANRCLRPFSPAGSRAEDAGDIMPEADHNADMNDRDAYEGVLSPSQLGPGPGYFQDTTFVFYVPENIQGVLLPENDDPSQKVYESISDIDGIDYGKLSTYVDFSARRENNGVGYSGTVNYRFYLGDDTTSDFSVVRNRRYDVQLVLTEKGIFADSWKVTRGNDWRDSRVLYFLEEPYIVYKGYDRNVMVHYHRMSSSVLSSQKYPDDWYFEVDSMHMRNCGVDYSFDPDVLVKGANGMSDFCIGFRASEDAVSGMSFPIRIMSWDGALSDYATIQVAELDEIAAVWDFCPEYVSQYGILTVSGIPDDKKPAVVSCGSGRVLEYERLNDTTFRIVAVGAGTDEVRITNADGSQDCVSSFDIKAPVLDLHSERISLNPDGTVKSVAFSYRDHAGNVIGNVDENARRTYLSPVMDGYGYCMMECGDHEFDIWIGRLHDGDDVGIPLGGREKITLVASACDDVRPVQLEVYYVDPFGGAVPERYGRIDDYTLLDLAGTPEIVREYFTEDVSANSSFTYEVPMPDAAVGSISASMIPAWYRTFSYPNEVFDAGYVSNGDRAYVEIRQNEVTASTLHGAGTHQIVLSVKNMHSGESVEHICGLVDVYVHAAMGAEAEIGYRSASYAPLNGTSFADVYNALAGTSLYPEQSSSYIYYMDVSVGFISEVKGVRVFAEMAQAASSMQNTLNALDIVRPAVKDGYREAETSLMYSVWNGDADRVNIGGESSHMRAGIGNVLYRALKMQPYPSVLSYEKRIEAFFGASSGSVPVSYMPEYTVHDMTKGTDMTKNAVSRNKPFHFTPSSFSTYTDAEGRGYHVIHFVDHIDADSGGWVNMLD